MLDTRNLQEQHFLSMISHELKEDKYKTLKNNSLAYFYVTLIF